MASRRAVSSVLPLVCAGCLLPPESGATGSDTDTTSAASTVDATGDATSLGPGSSGASTTGATSSPTNGVTTSPGTASTTDMTTAPGTTGTTTSPGTTGGDDKPHPVVTELWTFDAMDLGDIDGDGLLDLVTQGTGAPPRVTVYPGRGDGTFDKDAAVDSQLSSFLAFIVADVTGDGRADVLTQGTGMPSRITAHAGQGDHTVSELAATQVPIFAHMHAADMTGDGRADVLLGNGDTNSPWVRVYPGTAGGLADAPVFEGNPFLYANMRSGDVDGDGFADLVTGSTGNPPQLYVHPGAGDGSFGDPVISQIHTHEFFDLGDLDGDGRLDAVTNSPSNAWLFQRYRSTADGFVDAPLLDGFNYLTFELGDVDNDNLADIVAKPTGMPPRVEVYLSPGL